MCDQSTCCTAFFEVLPVMFTEFTKWHWTLNTSESNGSWVPTIRNPLFAKVVGKYSAELAMRSVHFACWKRNIRKRSGIPCIGCFSKALNPIQYEYLGSALTVETMLFLSVTLPILLLPNTPAMAFQRTVPSPRCHNAMLWMHSTICLFAVEQSTARGWDFLKAVVWLRRSSGVLEPCLALTLWVLVWLTPTVACQKFNISTLWLSIGNGGHQTKEPKLNAQDSVWTQCYQSSVLSAVFHSISIE